MPALLGEGEAEIGDTKLAVVVQKDVLRLQILLQHVSMNHCQGPGELMDDFCGFLVRQFALAEEKGSEVLLHEIQREVDVAVFRELRAFEELNDRRVVKLRQHDLAELFRDANGIFRQVADNLQGYCLVGLLVRGAVDSALPTVADFGVDLIAAAEELAGEVSSAGGCEELR